MIKYGLLSLVLILCGLNVAPVSAQCPEVLVDLPSTVTLCDHDTLLLGTTVQPDHFYAWNTGDTSAGLVIALPGIYSVTVTNACGNVAVDSVIVGLLEAPEVAIEGIAPLCPGDTVLLSATGPDVVDTYRWSNGDTSAQTLITTAGMYFLTVTNACGENFYDIRLPEAMDCPAAPLIPMPNAFSPDGDGVNDTFGPLGTGFTSLSFQIFNRWGELVFDGKENQVGWDGTIRGQPAATDVYVWQLIRVFSADSRQVREQGEVTLLR